MADFVIGPMGGPNSINQLSENNIKLSPNYVSLFLYIITSQPSADKIIWVEGNDLYRPTTDQHAQNKSVQL